jgi:hypothetical protein
MLFNLLSLLERLASSKSAQAARREKLLSLLGALGEALELMARESSGTSAATARLTNATSDFLSSYKLLAPAPSEHLERLASALEAAATQSEHSHMSAEQVHQLLAEVSTVVAVLR